MDDFILNGQASGDVATRLLDNNFNIQVLRPFIGKDGRTYMTVNNEDGTFKAVPVANANATLRKNDWLAIDAAVIKAAQPRLKLVGDLRGAGLQYTIPNGMGKTSLESESVSDIEAATISMDGLRQGAPDRPQFGLVNLPLPIIHKDFHFSARQVMASRNGGSPLDTTMAELAARKVAEECEKLTIGVRDSYSFGGGTVAGLINFSGVLPKVLTAPTDSAWTPKTFLTEVIAMRELSKAAYYYGPWTLYVGTGWDAYLDEDWKDDSDITLRDRVRQLEGITDIKTLDYLPGFDVVLLQMTSEVVRMVIGQELTTLQWETQGGLQLNFKVMAIMVPQLRSDFNGNTGIVYGAAA